MAILLSIGQVVVVPLISALVLGFRCFKSFPNSIYLFYVVIQSYSLG